MAKTRKKTWKFWIGLCVAVLLGGICGGLVGAFFFLAHDLPEIQGLESLSPPRTTRVYSADGVLLAQWYTEKRDPVPLSEIPEDLVNALLTTEDRSFYRHSGVDLRGLLRAVVHNLRARRFVEGGSTLTQQLSKTLFLTPEKSLKRKFSEAILSWQIERRYTKDEILAMYLNQVYFGSHAYGVKTAARTFFNKNLEELTRAECALIAGMPQRPSYFTPYRSLEAATRRRNLVLLQMKKTGLITPAQYEADVQEPVVTSRPPAPGASAGYFVAWVRGQLEEQFGHQALYQSGWIIHTTLDARLQEVADQAVARGVETVGQRTELDDIQAALVCLDVRTGGVRAMAGGSDFETTRFNRAVMAQRQPGSAFKPLVYALALEQGAEQTDAILDAPVAYPSGRPGEKWVPKNYEKDFLGEISLRHALAVSRNIPAVRLADELSPEAVARFAARLGVRSELSPYLSLALGASEVNLLELVGAYGVFANHGEWVQPHAVTEIIDARGRAVWQAHPEKKAAMSATGAALAADMLRAVVKEGTGRRVKDLAPNLAGKTGTTTSYKDAWFVGFSPELACGVWVGADSGQSMGFGETGARAALPIWKTFMKTALDKQEKDLNLPPGLTHVKIHPVTGETVKNSDPDGVWALVRR